VVPQLGLLAIQISEPADEVVAAVGIDAVDPLKLLADELRQVGMVGQPLQVGRDRGDNVILQRLGRNLIPLRAQMLAAAMMAAADVIACADVITCFREAAV
jgi:hypothetical protein